MIFKTRFNILSKLVFLFKYLDFYLSHNLIYYLSYPILYSTISQSKIEFMICIKNIFYYQYNIISPYDEIF